MTVSSSHKNISVYMYQVLLGDLIIHTYDLNPNWDKYDETFNRGAKVYGAEYQMASDSSSYGGNYGHQDVPCAVCMTHGRTRSLMIPGKSILAGSELTELSV